MGGTPRDSSARLLAANVSDDLLEAWLFAQRLEAWFNADPDEKTFAVLRGRGIARHGYPVHAEGRRTGVVTSGTMSPTLGVPIAMAYVAPGDAEPGTMLEVEIRDARVPAEVVPLPFYQRPA